MHWVRLEFKSENAFDVTKATEHFVSIISSSDNQIEMKKGTDSASQDLGALIDIFVVAGSIATIVQAIVSVLTRRPCITITIRDASNYNVILGEVNLTKYKNTEEEIRLMIDVKEE